MHQTILEKYLFENCIINRDLYDFHLLLENRLDFIKSKYAGRLDNVVDRIADTVDPTQNKKYTEWLVNQHRKGEDVFDPSVKESLTHFSNANSKIHDTNINNHSIESMKDVAHIVRTSPKQVKPGELELQYNEDGVKGYRLPDKETTIQNYGPGRKFETRWCHAADSEYNAFNTYEGNKYTMHFPNGSYLGFHHASMQTKDPDNHEIDFNHDKRYSEYVPHIKKFIEKTAQDQGIRNILGQSRFGEGNEEKFQKSWNNMDKIDNYVHFHENFHLHKLNDDQFNYVMREYENEPELIQKNIHLTPNQISRATHGFTKISDHLLENPSLKDEQFNLVYHTLKNDAINRNTNNYFANSPERRLRRLTENSNLTDHVVDDIISERHSEYGDRFDDLLDNIIHNGRYKFTDDQLDHLDRFSRENGKANDAYRVAHNQKVPEFIRKDAVYNFAKQIQVGVMQPGEYKSFVRHNDVKANELGQLINIGNKSSSYYKRRYQAALLHTPSLTQEHKDAIINSAKSDANITSELVSSPFLTKNEAASLYSRNRVPYELRPFFSRRDVNGQDATSLVNRIDPEKTIYTADDIADSGYFKLKNVPNEVLSKPEYADVVGKHLHYQPNASKEVLHNVIDNAKNLDSDVINHKSFNMDHANKILEKADAYTLDHVIKNSPRIPDSIKRKAKEKYDIMKRDMPRYTVHDPRTFDDDDIPF
jgi:hypothetical protein